MEDIKLHLAEKGWAIVPGVISPADCEAFIQSYQPWLARFGDGFPQIGESQSVIHTHRVAHHPTNWAVRLRVKPVFTQIWGTDKLLTSIDGMAIGQPPELGKFTTFENSVNHNFHMDQVGLDRQGIHCYQGALFLKGQTEEDWGMKFVEGSHKFYEDFWNTFDSRLMNDEQIDWYLERGCVRRRVAVPQGALLLWNSCTVHAGAKPLKGRKDKGLWRYVVFVAMTPAIWSSEEDLALKKKCYEELEFSGHQPSMGVSTTTGMHKEPNCVEEMPEIAKTDDAKKLVGLIPYAFDDGKPNGPPRPIWNKEN